MQYVIFISRVILFVFPSVRRHFLLSRELKKSMSVQLKMEKLKVQKFLFFFLCTLGVGGGRGLQNKTKMKIFDDLNRCKKIVNMQASIPPPKKMQIFFQEHVHFLFCGVGGWLKIERVDVRSRFQISTAEWFNGVFLCLELIHNFRNTIRPWSYRQILALVTPIINKWFLLQFGDFLWLYMIKQNINGDLFSAFLQTW